MSRQAVLYFDDVVGVETLTVNISPVQLQNYHGSDSVNGVDANPTTGCFTVRVPGTYLVLFNMSFTFTNGAEVSTHIYKNGTVTRYGAHGWGLTSLRSNMSVMVPIESLNKGDVISIHFTTDVDGRTLTIYDTQFSLIGI